MKLYCRQAIVGAINPEHSSGRLPGRLQYLRQYPDAVKYMEDPATIMPSWHEEGVSTFGVPYAPAEMRRKLAETQTELGRLLRLPQAQFDTELQKYKYASDKSAVPPEWEKLSNAATFLISEIYMHDITIGIKEGLLTLRLPKKWTLLHDEGIKYSEWPTTHLSHPLFDDENRAAVMGALKNACNILSPNSGITVSGALLAVANPSEELADIFSIARGMFARNEALATAPQR